MMYVFDKNEKLVRIIAKESIISSIQTEELNGLTLHTVEVSYDPELEECAYFGFKDPLAANTFYQFKVTSRTKEDEHIRLEGVLKFFDDLQGRGYVKDIRPTNQSVVAPVAEVLAGTGWRIGVDTTTKKVTTNIYYQSKLQAFWEIVNTSGVEFKVRSVYQENGEVEQYVDLADRISRDYGRGFVHGDKLLTVLAETDEAAIATAFLGRGKGEEVIGEDGLPTGGYGRRVLFNNVWWSRDEGHPVDKPLGSPIVELPEATARYGYSDGSPRIEIVTFEDIEDPAELLQATYNYGVSAARPKVQYQATVEENRPVEIGEVVHIRRDDLNINYDTRVLSVERSFLEPTRQSVTFGDEIIPSSAAASINRKREAKKQEERTASSIERVANGIRSSWLNSDGCNYELDANNSYGLPAGYYSFNLPIDQNPTEVIGISAGKLVIASTRNPDGTWNFTTFGNGQGFTANAVNTGTLNANLVQTGVLSSVDGSSWFDLENNAFSFANDAITYSPDKGILFKTIPDGGGSNLIKNSVGYAGTKFWVTSAEGVATHNSTWINTNSTAKYGFILTPQTAESVTLSQRVQLKRDTEYSLSFKLNREPDVNFFKINLLSSNETVEILDIAPMTSSGTSHKMTFNTGQDNEWELSIELQHGGSKAVELTDIGIYEGRNVGTWQPNAGETYTPNIRLDQDGLTVVSADGKSQTNVNPHEFAGYFNGELSFAVNGYWTISQAVRILGGGLEIAPIKLIQSKERNALIGVWEGWK